MLIKSLLLAALLSAECMALGRKVPSNVKDLYNYAKNHRCRKPLSSSFQDGHGRKGFVYCGDRLDSQGIIYITGPSNSRGLADMDVDCDGANRSAGDCKNDPSGQDQTAFKDEVKKYGIPDLDSNKHGYVVLGNEGSSPSFNPAEYGIKPLSVVAVVCNNRLFYGVWGDTNGGTLVGETSVSLAQACFPKEGLNGDNGHEKHDVLYIAFKGNAAKPGAKGANWKAKNFAGFEKSLEHIGNKLVKKVST
ncbi:chitosanase [Coccidioides immitis RS]|uniref:Endo-chitosanase n=3 Tax=Coccidioides immitis TaxID=5501 RepID=J3K346_COCIM|nr:chitosanase [Coccidioides immitis RS]EAS28569.3 chitosanase [Coccidioides immitis RS]KMP02642.1 chitosanase [Coccidioides immitis RMSCC 2394]TPX23150.1 hypothetical protein DIZ76_012475 [Coccidioides immitis]